MPHDRRPAGPPRADQHAHGRGRHTGRSRDPHRGGWLSGTTVVLAPPDGAVGGVDVRGGGPGTRETDLLDPRNLVERVHAVVLSGGSAFGLAAADGVMQRLAADGVGFPVQDGVVPIVPGAVDLRPRPRRRLREPAGAAAGQRRLRCGQRGPGPAGGVRGRDGCESRRAQGGGRIGKRGAAGRHDGRRARRPQRHRVVRRPVHGGAVCRALRPTGRVPFCDRCPAGRAG